MALVANKWYQVTWTTPIPANVPPWDVSQQTTLPGLVVQNILTATSMFIFSIAPGIPSDYIAYLGSGSSPVIIPNGVVTVTATPAMNTQTMDDGSTWYSMRDGVAWLWYNDITATVYRCANSAALGTFIS
jgi:hypothetical protein